VSIGQFVVTGPTASGKTSMAIALAQKVGGEIISADSRQVYQGGDLASGKDLEDYGSTPYHLIDVVPMVEEYSVFDYQSAAIAVRDRLISESKTPIVCGGTLFYIEAYLASEMMIPVPIDYVFRDRVARMELDAIVSELKSYGGATHNTTDTLDRDRAIRALEIAIATHDVPAVKLYQPSTIIAVLDPPREVLRANIQLRLDQRLACGLVEEIESLLSSGVTPKKLELMGLEYRYVARYVAGEVGFDEMKATLAQQIMRYAKQQAKGVRRLERKGWSLERQHPSESTQEFVQRLARLVQ